ncbi:MAG: trypsin-like serine protease [Kofleriaceae bacterium]
MRLVAAILVAWSASVFAGPAPIVGGENAPAGKWPDAAAIIFGDGTDTSSQAECSGTLIAPNVVVTAGHCNDATVKFVLVGTTSLTSGGELLPVMQRIEYPNSQTSEDVTILVLGQTAAEEPRKLATGWATLDILNGAAIELVGYGAIDVNAQTYINDLQEVQSTITDYNCTVKDGCNAAAQPNGELGAGGGGIDTCNGDSGGPLYLLTDYGTFLAGVTSRSYDDSSKPCGDGGIYERPDKWVDWAEQMSGQAIERGPEPDPRKVSGVPGGPIEFHINPNDPKSHDHAFELTTPPAHGTAVLRDDGELRMCMDASGQADSMTVTITDTSTDGRALVWTIPITPTSGDAPATCDPNAFEEKDSGGGCCDAGRSAGGSIPLAAFVAIALSRRRRRA